MTIISASALWLACLSYFPAIKLLIISNYCSVSNLSRPTRRDWGWWQLGWGWRKPI